MVFWATVEAASRDEETDFSLELSELEMSLGPLVVLVSTVLVAFKVLVDASWGKEIGNLLVLSKLEESLDLLAEEVVKELSWRRSFISKSSFLAVTD